MLECTIGQAATLKKILDAVKELVTDGNFDCSDAGLALQAMDNSHVALVALLLRASAFHPYRCDANLSLGINLVSLSKILKCASNDDQVSIKADSNVDSLSLTFESKSKSRPYPVITFPSNPLTNQLNPQDGARVSEYDLKLMDIDSDHLGIPDTPYEATVKMSSVEFQRICRDLRILNESIIIDVTKDGVKFSSTGDLGNGSIFIKNGQSSIDEAEEEEATTTITLASPVSLTFSLKYLCDFAKATPLSSTVTLSLSNDVPLLVEYAVPEVGHIRYYLAPKIGEDN
ncbi:proliferating cell nuclear antigen [Physocladia obscura]|uniref:DNA sliding clamp PCNA n=1 Tax=Physocladia obscura TaxID=109957 RepID=A0AAD5XI18_9FUNG|nr:proliferating cell nuclear antigen [Physocladia obscura]